jgi:hypothetical protein
VLLHAFLLQDHASRIDLHALNVGTRETGAAKYLVRRRATIESRLELLAPAQIEVLQSPLFA